MLAINSIANGRTTVVSLAISMTVYPWMAEEEVLALRSAAPAQGIEAFRLVH